eukprot:NODE_96_length_21330_cov_0.419858.p9 type:complete len:127 gc:universal NODE_96_length_21330_cov_0.419858:7060-6680(-)
MLNSKCLLFPYCGTMTMNSTLLSPYINPIILVFISDILINCCTNLRGIDSFCPSFCSSSGVTIQYSLLLINPMLAFILLLQSALLLNCSCSYLLVVTAIISSPCTLNVLTASACTCVSALLTISCR